MVPNLVLTAYAAYGLLVRAQEVVPLLQILCRHKAHCVRPIASDQLVSQVLGSSADETIWLYRIRLQ